MNQYSQLIGSFFRTSNYPLEANYIFETVDDLKEFYSDELQKATLHKGLFKIVEKDKNGQQTLYWVNDDLEFVPLISENSLENIKALIGTDEDNIEEYLETLHFPNITELSKALDRFLKDNSVLKLAERVKNRCDNLQSELNQTQVGVGLSGDGSYSADKETNYLKDATSVMNALKTLDAILYKTANSASSDVVTGIYQKFDESYTPETADLYIIERPEDQSEELQLTFTPLSPAELTVPETIGDIEKGTTAASLNGKALSEILDSILFKTIYPTITNPSVTITASTQTVEAGSTLYSNFSKTFNKGSVVVNDGVTATIDYVGEEGSSQYYVKVTGGAANTNAGVSAYPSAGDALVNTLTRYEPGTYQYKVTTTYGEGPLMATSKGASPNPMPTTNSGNVENPHPAGSVTSTYGVTINVTLPVFVDPANKSYAKQALKTWGAMTFTGVAMGGTTRDNPIKIKTPRKLESVNSYNSVSGKYDVAQLSNFSMSETSETVNNASYTYYEYTWNGGALDAVNMEIKTF